MSKKDKSVRGMEDKLSGNEENWNIFILWCIDVCILLLYYYSSDSLLPSGEITMHEEKSGLRFSSALWLTHSVRRCLRATTGCSSSSTATPTRSTRTRSRSAWPPPTAPRRSWPRPPPQIGEWGFLVTGQIMKSNYYSMNWNHTWKYNRRERLL